MDYNKNKIIKFLSAQTISLFGSSIVQYAIIWHITLTTSSGIMMTFSTICGFAPQIIISLFAGVWIDRYNRKKMIMIADIMIATATAILLVLFLLGQKSVILLFIVLLIRSAGTGIQTPAVNAIIPQIVPSERLMKINGINSTINSLMMFLSPAVSGAILSVTSIEVTLLIDVITAIIGVGILTTIKIPNIAVKNKGKINNSHIEEIKEGFAYLKSNPFIKRLLLFMIVVAVLISPSAFLTPLMVSRAFGAEVWRLTASEMVFSAGAMLGGILIATWGGFKNRIHTTLLAGFFYGALMICMGVSQTFFIYLVFNLLIGITMPCYNAPITVHVQQQVQPDMHGRVFSLIQVATSCSLPLGMMIFGPLADTFRVEHLLIVAGAVVVGIVALAWSSKFLTK